jgi:hypothetical protein
MSCYVGKDGVVKVGSDAVGEVTNFSLEVTAETIECTVMGDTYRGYESSFINWSGSVDVHWDPDDTGQTALVIGTKVQLALYPEGDEAGDTEYAGQAIVTSFTRSAAFDGFVEASIAFQGDGELTTDSAS